MGHSECLLFAFFLPYLLEQPYTDDTVLENSEMMRKLHC